MTDIIITAPLAGWAAGLNEVPDPVFADSLMGDGLAIHPTGTTLHAPCDGVVATFHAAGHALTIRHASGAEILVHVGLETVALGGRGFRPRVAEGVTVSRGDPLLDFDLDAIAQAATSAVTPVVVVNSEDFRIAQRIAGGIVAPGDPLLTLRAVTATGEVGTSAQAHAQERTVIVPLVHGLHARPAARISALARQFDAEVEIVHGARRANARSAVAVMGLTVTHGDSIAIAANGREAEAAADAVSALIAGGMDELPTAVRVRSPVAPSPQAASTPEGAIAGVVAAPGLALGPAYRLIHHTPTIERDADDAQTESTALETALAEVRVRMTAAVEGGSEAQRQILAAHLVFLDDEELLALARAQMAAGRSAGFAWREAIAAQTTPLLASGDPRFAERVADLTDIEQQVLLALHGADFDGERAPHGAILLADDILPSQFAALDPGAVAGIVLRRGGATSHAAIMAASAGLPMLAAVGSGLDSIVDGTMLALDADAGLLHVDPPAAALAVHRERIELSGERKAAARAAAHKPCRTTDGTRIEVLANIGSVADAELAAAQGADGSGLVRTEFLFLDRPFAPGEDEQHACYQAIATTLAGRPVVVRLLDIGGDKPAAFLPIETEANPMLGQRGIRALLAHPELLATQLRAILKVAPAGQCRIMVPMVTGPDEMRAVRDVVSTLIQNAQIGAMIETPAAAMTADLIAAEADFLSIGTNDLTQYTLAMDRENPALAAQVDALHPAVLRLIAQTCEAAARHDRPVAVCGGLASDPVGVPLLIGLGVTELSVTPACLPDIKALVRRLDRAECCRLAAHACTLSSARTVRTSIRSYIDEELG